MRANLMILGILALAACNAEPDPSANGGEDPAVAQDGGQENDRAGDGNGDATGDALAGNSDNGTGARDPEETRPPEADDQTPAFAGQTRAPKPRETEQWTTETVAEGLEHPWALEFLPDGSMLVTERPGTLRHVSPDGELSEPIAGVPEVDDRNQGGLLDVAIAPDFASSRTIFLTFSEPRDGDRNNTAVARARFNEAGDALEDVEVIFRQEPAVAQTGHFGSRIVFAGDDLMWVTTGDRQGAGVRHHAQDPHNHIGSIVRIRSDGSVPDDNPFSDGEDGAREVWSYGHRNLQGADRHPDTGELWTIEHGPRGGDELNQPQPGENYGWPEVTYGIDYSGEPMGEGITARDGVEQPVYYWDPVIAPGGMDFYEGDRFETWQGDLFIAGLASQQVVRLVLDVDEKRVQAEEWLEIGHRVRDVREGPDGAIYLVTDESDGRVMRIVPDPQG